MCLAIYSKHTSAVKHGCFLKRLVRFRGNLTMQFLKTRSNLIEISAFSMRPQYLNILPFSRILPVFEVSVVDRGA